MIFNFEIAKSYQKSEEQENFRSPYDDVTYIPLKLLQSNLASDLVRVEAHAPPSPMIISCAVVG
jgi:hypothetical protein